MVLAALLLATAPLLVSEETTGISIRLPLACMAVPAVKFDAKACAPYPEKELALFKQAYEGRATAQRRTLAVGVLEGGLVEVHHVAVRTRRAGKVPGDFIERLVHDEVAAAQARPDAKYEIETFNGVTALRIDMTLSRPGGGIATSAWIVLTPTSNFSVWVQNSPLQNRPRERLLRIGREIMSTLAVPENQRVDLNGRVPVPSE